MKNIFKKFYSYFFSFILFYIFISFFYLRFLINIDFSIDEAFMILNFLILILVTLILYLLVLLIMKLCKIKLLKIFTKSKLDFILSLILLIGISILFIVLFTLSYWNSLELFSNPIKITDLKTEEIFNKIEWGNQEDFIFIVHKNIAKSDLIEYVKKSNDQKIDKHAVLFFLTNEDSYAHTYKNYLLEEALNQKFLDSGGSVKFWQFEVSLRLYYYLKLQEARPNLFTKEENEQIIKWFHEINMYSYKVTLADYAYAYLFKQEPIGFYYNQEIGFGMLALFNEILKDIDPQLVERNKKILEEKAVGWENNFRNTDDGIEYHQNIWLINSYFLYKYSNLGNFNNAKLGFDWIVFQSPYQRGTHPNYNSHSQSPAINSMLIGMDLLNDGRYKYIAENMINYNVENKIYPDTLIGFEFWNEELKSTQPEINSYFIKGTTGTNAQPKELKPDKLSLRKIINDKELFILVNLRSAGWHRYNGSGSIIFMQYGDQILLKDNISSQNYFFIPKGKSQHRDKKITSEELNIIQPPSEGIEKIFSYLFFYDKTLKYKNYDKFIGKYTINEDKVIVQLDNKNFLNIQIKDNILKIYYNDQSQSFINQRLD